MIVQRSESDPGPSAYGEYDLVTAVYRYTENLIDIALFTWSEIPAGAVQVYCLVDYLGQVDNGGHSQYVANRLDVLETRSNLAAAGMEAIGAREHLAILRDLQTWFAANSFVAARQTGFQGGRASELDELDARLRSLEKSDPLEPRLSEWIASWPELRIVDDADYTDAIRRLNPRREARRIQRSIGHITERMLTAGVEPGEAGYPAAAIDLILRKAGLSPEASYAEPDRDSAGAPPNTRHWIVMCDFRPFCAVTGDNGAVLVPTDNASADITATRAEIDAHWEYAKTGAM